jgi:hypothetical protein
MRPPGALAAVAPHRVACLGALAGVLPGWAVLALVGTSALLTVTQVVITQIIRLRASANTRAALRLLELELKACSRRQQAK